MLPTTTPPPEEPQAPHPRTWRRWLFFAFAVVVVLAIGAFLYLESSAFRETVRKKLVAEFEQSTGARVELREFDLNLARLEVRLRGLVLHGSEPDGAPPLFSANGLVARWHLVSFWRLNADLSEVELEEPRINITVAQDGSSNLPASLRENEASNASGAATSWAPRLLDLEIGRIEVLRGELHWNLRNVPLDFRAEQLHLQLGYEPPKNRYSGQLSFRNAILTSGNSASLNSQTQARLALYSDHAEIESVSWETAKSKMTLQGRVSDFQSPRFEFQYTVSADWADLGAVLGTHRWVGSIASQGKAKVGGGPWSLEGDLSAHTARSGIPGWGELPWTARAKVRVAAESSNQEPESQTKKDQAPWRATIEDLRADILGGQLSGSANIRDSAGGPLTQVELEARSLSLPWLERASTALPLRLDSLPWAGSLSGPVRLHFTGPGRNLTLEMDLSLVPQPVVPVGFVAPNGKLSFVYEAARQRVESRDSYVDLPHTHLSANGWFDDRDSQMHLAANTEDLTETRPLGEILWKGFKEIPVRLNGRAGAEMNWTGGTDHARFAGSFEVRDFAYQDQPWDNLSGKLDYRAAGATAPASVAVRVGTSALPVRDTATLAISSAELKRGTATMDFDVSLGLENGTYSQNSPFSLQGRIRGVHAEELQQMVGGQYSLAGLVEASFSASGTLHDPTGKGRVSLTQGTIQGESFDRLTVDLRLDHGIWTADPIQLAKGSGTLRGSVSIDEPGRKFKFDLTGAAIPLGSLHSLAQGETHLAGIAEGKLSGEGTFDKPLIRGQIRVRQLAYGNVQSGAVTLDISSNDQRADWTISGDLWGGELRAKGETTLTGAYPMSADITLQNLNLAPLISTLQHAPETVGGRVSGTAHAEGSVRDLKDFSVRGQLDSMEANVRSLSFHSVGSTQIQYQNRELRLSPLHVQGPQLQFETSGTVRIAQPPELNLNAQGQMNLAALNQADPQFASSGEVKLDAQISGTTESPLWHGRLSVADGSIHYGDVPNGFDHINGGISFNGTRGSLDKVTAESGGGQIQLGGFVNYVEGTGWQLNLTGQASSVRVRYPEGMSTWVNGQFVWTGTINSSLLEGRAMLMRESVSPQFDLVQALLSKKTAEKSPATMPEMLRNMRLNIELTSAPDLRLDTLTTKNLQADMDLRIQGTAAQPVWLGRIGILDGEILFAGKRYTVNHGEITFVNPFRFEPILNLSVQAHVQRYDISMDFNGPPDRLTVTYRSDPPLQTRDILSLLVAGKAQETSLVSTTNEALPQVGADTLLSQALSSQIGSRLDRLFGTGRVRVDPQISGLGRSTNASVALEQQVTDNLSLLYVTDVTSTQQQTIQAEWTISPKLSVVGIRDQNGLIGVNFQITLRFR